MASIPSFEDFKLNRQLLNAVEEMGYEQPTEIQCKCIPIALGGQEIIGIAQTGTGKTAAYLLPLLMKLKFAQEKEPRGVVLAPTKELVLQITEQALLLAKYTDLRIVSLFGGIGPKSQTESILQGVDLIIGTPGRFMEFYRKSVLPTKFIKTLILDEADRMMDMGFMPQLRKILEVIPVKRQNLLFSATFSQKVEQLSEEFLEFPVKIEITPQATTARQVNQVLYHIPNIKSKINFLAFLLNDPEIFNRVIIFTRTKENANNVFNFLDRKGYGPVRVIHSNKGQNTRINALNEFKSGDIRILVSTDVTSRGIDIQKVSHVINFDVPLLYEDYVHRVGRTGRAFQVGEAITLVNEAEKYHIEKIESLIREKIPEKPLPKDLEILETPFEEQQQMAKEIDNRRKKEDPSYKGAFHDKKEDLKPSFNRKKKRKK